jgi:hypothetical protein
MSMQWTAAALVSTALLVGCGGETPENTQNLETNVPIQGTEEAGVAEVAPPVDDARSAPRASGDRDSSAINSTRRAPAPRATTGLRPAPADEFAGDRQPDRTVTSARETPAPPAPRWREVTVSAGTALPIELLTALSSETAAIETPVRARLRQAVVVDGYTALPAGTVLHGHVTDVDRAGRVQGRSRLAFAFTEAEFDGGREDVRTNPLAFEGEATKGEDATKIGVGAGVGAAIGGLLGGGDGAAKGAAIGGAAGTGVVLSTRGREVTIESGRDLTATVATPFSVRAPR